MKIAKYSMAAVLVWFIVIAILRAGLQKPYPSSDAAHYSLYAIMACSVIGRLI